MKSRTGYTYFDQKKKRWVGIVMLPADPVTGKRKSVRSFGLTEADVRKKLRKLVDIIEGEVPASIPVDRLTFADLAKEYEENEWIPVEYIVLRIKVGGQQSDTHWRVLSSRSTRITKSFRHVEEHFPAVMFEANDCDCDEE
jgi:hypothetical protein